MHPTIQSLPLDFKLSLIYYGKDDEYEYNTRVTPVPPMKRTVTRAGKRINVPKYENVAYIEVAFTVDGIFSDYEKSVLDKSIHDSIRTSNIQEFLVKILSAMDTNVPNTHAERKIGNVERFLLERVMRKHPDWDIWQRVKLYDVVNFYLRYESQRKKNPYSQKRSHKEGVYLDDAE